MSNSINSPANDSMSSLKGGSVNWVVQGLIKHFSRLVFSLCLVFTSIISFNLAAAPYIEFVEFKEAKVKDAARILSSMTGANIAVTKEASDEPVSLLLQKTELKNAIEMVSRVAGLWYRYNKASNSYIIMTERQYQDDIVVYRDDVIRTFTLKHQNVNSTAVTIQSLFGDRVRLTLQKDNDDFAGLDLEIGDTNEATTVADRNSSSGNADIKIQELERQNLTDESKGAIEEDLSAGALRQLGDKKSLDADVAGRLLGAKTPIFIATNKIHNLLHVRTSDENAMAEIARLVRDSDKPTPQVLLEMKIVKINVGEGYKQDFDLDFNTVLSKGGDFRGNGTASPATFDPETASYNINNIPVNQVAKTFAQLRGEVGTGFGFNGRDGGFYEFFSKYVTAKIALLEKNNQAEVVAKPVMLASNNRPARLFIGSEQVVPVSLDTKTEFSAANNNGDRTSATTTTLETERRKIGNTLILLPSVNSDRSVTIDIFQDSSSIERNGMNFPFFSNATNTLGSIPMDSVQESNVKTIVVAKDGKTIALGGMINSEQSEVETVVPLLGNIPLIGELFRSKETKDETSQYVMLITPHVLLSPEESEEKSRKVAELDYDNNAEILVSERQYDVSEYIEMVRYAAAMGRGHSAVRPVGLQDVPVSLSPLSFVFSDPALSVWPVGSWQRAGLHITLLKARNNSKDVVALSLAEIPGGWLAAAGDQNRLAASGVKGDETQLYLLSSQPFNQVVAQFNQRRR